MKKLLAVMLVVGLFACAAAFPLLNEVVYAQNSGKSQQNSNKKPKKKAGARDLYIEHADDDTQGLPGAKVRILLSRNGKESYVTPNENFVSGDKIKLAFDVNFEGHVALLNLGSSGKFNLLYPFKGADSSISSDDAEILIPGGKDTWIKFDNKVGTEQISIVFSKNAIQSIQEVIDLSGGNGNGNSSGGGTEIYLANSNEAQAILSELNSRSLKRAKSRDLYIETASNDATYCVGSSQVITEPTAFVISLKHGRR